MVRAVSAAFWEGITYAQTDKDFHVLVTITHPAIETIRVVSDVNDIVSNGETFIGFPFGFVLPSESEEVPRGSLQIQNVDQRIVEAVLSIRTYLRLQVDVVLLEAPNTLQYSYKNMRLVNTRGDAVMLEGDIVFPDYSTIPFGLNRITKARFPGIFY